MISGFQIRKFIELPIILVILLATSFLNYCITQVVGTYFLPLTIMLIYFAAILEFEIPIFFIAGIGLFDDSLANGFLGLYAFIYLILSYFVMTKLKDLPGRKYITGFFILVFALTNFLTFNN